MITPKLYETLDKEERQLWHSHVYEVKSGMLIMPNRAVPESAWQVAENYEMDQVVQLYGKVYHLWQTDRGDRLPLGPPKLMTSFTADGQFDFEKHVGERDKRFGTDYKVKKEARKDIPEPVIHEGKYSNALADGVELTGYRCGSSLEEGQVKKAKRPKGAVGMRDGWSARLDRKKAIAAPQVDLL